MRAHALDGGFATPAIDAALAFRSVMEAMARPGTRHAVTGAFGPAPMSPAASAVVLTLCDADTPLFLAEGWDCDAVRAWIAFHTAAPLVAPSHCRFALGGWDALAPLGPYPVGSAEYPDRSATLIVDGPDMHGEAVTLTGPGIHTTASLAVPDAQALRANAALYPRGLDFIFATGDRISALPRSARLSNAQGASCM